MFSVIGQKKLVNGIFRDKQHFKPKSMIICAQKNGRIAMLFLATKTYVLIDKTNNYLYYLLLQSLINTVSACVDPEEWGGGWTGGPKPHPLALENHKAIGFLSNTGPDPLKNQASIQCCAIIDPPAKRHLNEASLVGR